MIISLLIALPDHVYPLILICFFILIILVNLFILLKF